MPFFHPVSGSPLTSTITAGLRHRPAGRDAASAANSRSAAATSGRSQVRALPAALPRNPRSADIAAAWVRFTQDTRLRRRATSVPDFPWPSRLLHLAQCFSRGCGDRISDDALPRPGRRAGRVALPARPAGHCLAIAPAGRLTRAAPQCYGCTCVFGPAVLEVRCQARCPRTLPSGKPTANEGYSAAHWRPSWL